MEDRSIKSIHVIVNPAAGPARPVLRIFNNVFRAAGVRWDMSITHTLGDGRRLAQASAAAGFDAVAAYGGDGTVTEVASGLIGSQTPLAILPGGTANLMAVEMGIPSDLNEACQLACNPRCAVRLVDIGRAGSRYFMQGIGIGVQARQVEVANRELKDRFGILAYLISGLQALQEATVSHYHLTLDGQMVECEGLTGLIVNIGNVGMYGLTLAPGVSVRDGLLDAFVIRSIDLNALLAIAASIMDRNAQDPNQPIQHWQARTVSVITDPPQAVQADGEVWGQTPVTAEILPGAVRIITRSRGGAEEP